MIKNKKNLILDLSLLLILVLFNLFMVNGRNLPYIYNDEFGYWATVAFLKKWSWGSLVSTLPYYSFGYGFILWLLTLITSSIQEAYKLSLLLNIIWAMGSYWLLYSCVHYLFGDGKQFVIRLVCAVGIVFPGVLSQTLYSWPEMFLLFLYLCQLRLLIIALSSKGLKWFTVLGAICAFDYYVHQRTIGITIALIVVLLLFSIKFGKGKEMLSFFVAFFLVIILGGVFKKSLISTMWLASPTTASNNLSGQIGKLEFILSFKGILALALSFLGKIFYAFASTMLLFPVAICWVVKKIKVILLQSNSNQNPKNNALYFCSFLILSSLFMLMVNSVSMVIPYNITHVFYGRYVDTILPIWIAIGLMAMFNNQVSIKALILILIIYAGLITIVKWQTNVFGLRYQAAINSAGTAYMAENNYFEAKKGFIVPTMIFSFIIAVNYFPHKAKSIAVLMTVFLLSCSFLFISVSTIRKFTIDWGYATIESNMVYSKLQDLSCDNTVPIFAYLDERGSYPQAYPGNGLQFLMEETPVVVFDGLSQFDKLMHRNGPWYMVISTKKLDEIRNAIVGNYDYDILYQTNTYTLIGSI